jgi:hypothetical protein
MFNENPCSGNRVVPCERTDGQNKETEMTKLIVAFRNLANMPNYSTYTSAYYTTGIINFTAIKHEIHQVVRLVCKSYQFYSSI